MQLNLDLVGAATLSRTKWEIHDMDGELSIIVYCGVSEIGTGRCQAPSCAAVPGGVARQEAQ